MRGYLRISLAIVVGLTVCLAAPRPSDALFGIPNPLKVVGDAAGGLLRGVGGVLGQGLAGFAQPTIEEAANQMQRVASAAITQADTAAGRRIDQLGDKIFKAIEEADGVVTKHLAELDEIITKKLGAVDIIATKQVNNFEQSIVEVVRYASLLFLVSAGLFVVFSILVRRFAAERFEKLGMQQLIGGCALLITLSFLAFIASNVLNPPSEQRMVALRDDLHRSYQYSMRLGDLSGATFYASQLNALDSTNFASRLLVETADVQRDLLLRPALFKTSKGALELATRIARIDRTWDLVQESKLDTSRVAFLEYELPATVAMVSWQTARSEKDEIAAMCAAFLAMQTYQRLGPKDGSGNPDPSRASPYMWLAYSYAKWARVRLPAGDRQCEDGKSIVTKSNDLQPLTAAFDAGRPNAAVAHVIDYNRAAVEYYAAGSRLYSTIVVADTQFRYKAAAEKPPHKTERDQAADTLIKAWSTFIQKAKANPALQGSNLILASTGTPAALLIRANALKGADNRGTFDLAACNNLAAQLAGADQVQRQNAEASPVGALLSLLEPTMRSIACAEQASLDAKFIQFENSLTEAYGAGKDPGVEKQALLRRPEYRRIASALIACIIRSDASVKGDRGCKPEEEARNSATLAQWMDPSDKYDPSDVVRIAFVR